MTALAQAMTGLWRARSVSFAWPRPSRLPAPWVAVITGMLLAPLVTWLPMLAARYPWLGLPPYQPAQGVDLWGVHMWWGTALGGLALWIGARDRWLGAAVFVTTFAFVWRGFQMDPTHVIVFAAGAGLLCLVRAIPVEHHGRILSALAWAGLFQAIYALHQAWLRYDVLWGPWIGGVLVDKPQPLGTLGTVNAMGAYVALTAPLLPWWLLPLPIAAILVSKSLGATLALTVGLLVRYRRDWRAWAAALCLLAFAAGPLLDKLKSITVSIRPLIWHFGLTSALVTHPVSGLGLGGWALHVPKWQETRGYLPSGEYFREAHNEPVQWMAETGALGIILLALWLWTHRAMFRHPQLGGSLCALACSSLTFFPLHVVPTALAAIVLIGLATPNASEPSPA